MAEVNWRGNHGRNYFKSTRVGQLITRVSSRDFIRTARSVGSVGIYLLVQIVQCLWIRCKHFKEPQREALGEKVMKDQVLALIASAKDGVDAKFAELVAAVEALPVEPEVAVLLAQIADLQAQLSAKDLIIADKDALLAAKDAELADKQAKLQAADQLAKQIDQSIEDA